MGQNHIHLFLHCNFFQSIQKYSHSYNESLRKLNTSSNCTLHFTTITPWNNTIILLSITELINCLTDYLSAHLKTFSIYHGCQMSFWSITFRPTRLVLIKSGDFLQSGHGKVFSTYNMFYLYIKRKCKESPFTC